MEKNQNIPTDEQQVIEKSAVSLDSEEQETLAMEAFSLGLPDRLTAKRLALRQNDIFKFRESKNISSKDILENRLDNWSEMIKNGLHLELISEMYDVKPASIRQMLWRERQFSFRDATKNLRLASLPKQIEEIKKGNAKLLGF